MKRRMKILLETHCHFAVDSAPPSEKVQRDGYNIIVKGCMKAPKKDITHCRSNNLESKIS